MAILLVLLHHFWPQSGVLQAYSPVIHLGWIGVDLFFVISGFLITGILLETKGDRYYFQNFYARRGLRIFPLYYAFLLAAFTLIPLCQQGRYVEKEFLQESGSPLWYLFYCGNLREAIFGREPAYILAPLWSLSIEEQFYLTFPLIVACVSTRRLTALLGACILLAPVWRATMLWVVPDNERIQYLATFSRLDVIAWGGLLAISLRAGRTFSRLWTNRLLVTAIAACVVAFCLGGLDRREPFCRVWGYSLVGVTFALLVLWAIQNRTERSSLWLRSSWLCNLGSLCYGIYLLQRPTEVALGKALIACGMPLSDDSVVLLILKCLAAIGVAWLSWRLFERPILAFKHRFTSSRHPSLATGHGTQVDSQRISVGTSPNILLTPVECWKPSLIHALTPRPPESA
jgi:peptidoglycan/LPS O-acetylase OafA/YrhL